MIALLASDSPVILLGLPAVLVLALVVAVITTILFRFSLRRREQLVDERGLTRKERLEEAAGTFLPSHIVNER